MHPLEGGETPEIYQDEQHLDTSNYYRQFSQNKCDVKALNSVFTYQNEYLGNRYCCRREVYRKRPAMKKSNYC